MRPMEASPLPTSSTYCSVIRSWTMAETVALVSPSSFAVSAREMGPRLMMVSSTRLRFMLRINSLLPVTMLLLSGGRVPACCILVSSIQQFVWKVNE